MAYRMFHKKADGSSTYKRKCVQDTDEDKMVPNYSHTSGVIMGPDRGKKQVSYNFGGGTNPSKAKREAEIRRDLEIQRQESIRTNGMSKGGTMRKVASIPPELYYSEKFEKGAGCFSDPKDIKKFCQENDLITVPKW